MAGPIEVQLRNAQSSILFMQQEHANTLKGLHSEIQKLHKKCAALTFDLAMRGDDPNEDQSKEEEEKLACKIETAEKEIVQLQEQLEERERKVFSLGQQLKVQEKKRQAEIKQHKQKLSSLGNELDQKSANIAYLTNQLHQMALTRQKARESVKGTVHANSPQPPQRPPPTHRRRVRTPSVESVSVLKNDKVTTTVTDRCSSVDLSLSYDSRHNRHLSSPSNSQSFDEREVAAFVAKVDKSTSDFEIKPAPPILPPISPIGQDRRNIPLPSGSCYSPNQSPYYTRRSLRVAGHRETEPAGIGSLAVPAVHRRGKDRHTPQHSNGDSP